LRLQRGESAELVVHQRGVDVVVDVRSPRGKLLDSVDGPTGRNGDERVEIIADESGPYGIEVRPFDDGEPAGVYGLEVTALRDARATAALLRTRREARDAAARWLRPQSVAIASSGLVESDDDVSVLDELARRVRVLGLGEATHGSREFGDLRLSLTRYLVERHGFRLIALEASASALDQLSPYMDGESDLTDSMARLLDSGWIGTRTRREMVEWLRVWNAAHPNDRVRLIGVDAQENEGARRTLGEFLGRAYGEALMQRWATAERELTAADEQTAVFGDSGVDAATRALLMEIVAMLELDAPLLMRRLGEPAVGSALEAARLLAEFADFNSGGGAAINHSRDWYMATRVLQALDATGASTKAVYWAHNAHVVHRPGSDRTAGELLRNALGCEYAALAATFGEGAFIAQIPDDPEDRLQASTLPAAPDESIESVLRAVKSGGVLAAWSCPAETDGARALPDWLTVAHPMHWVGGLHQPGGLPAAAFRSFDLVRDFDGVAYIPRVTAEAFPPNRPLVPPRTR
jgi:erythromycin esterase